MADQQIQKFRKQIWGEIIMDKKISHVIGGNNPPLLDYTIGQALDLAKNKWPQNMALIETWH